MKQALLECTTLINSDFQICFTLQSKHGLFSTHITANYGLLQKGDKAGEYQSTK